MNRLQAAGIHLAISAFIVISVLLLMRGLWYPDLYFKLMGGGGLLFIIAGVDISLGPLLTLVVFNIKKKSLKLDLSVIALFQLSALVYGIYVTFEARPVFTVFTTDQFQIAAAADISLEDLPLGKSKEWQSLPTTGPRIAFATAPILQKDKDVILSAALVGMDWHQFPRLYDNYKLHSVEILQTAQSLEKLRSIDQRNNAPINQFLSQKNRPQTDFVFVPLRSARQEMAAILNAKNANFEGIIDAKPWN